MCSCSHFFFRCHSVSPWWPLAFLIFSPPQKNFHVILPTKLVSFVFSLAPAVFSVIHVNVDIKFKSKERIGFDVVVVVVVFISRKVRVAMRFTAETPGYLKCKISARLT